MQQASTAATSSLSDRVLLSMDTQFRQRRSTIVKARDDVTLYPTEADYQAALDSLNVTYTSLVDNIATNRHHSLCQTDLSPFNLPAMSDLLEDLTWNGGLSAGA